MTEKLKISNSETLEEFLEKKKPEWQGLMQGSATDISEATTKFLAFKFFLDALEAIEMARKQKQESILGAFIDETNEKFPRTYKVIDDAIKEAEQREYNRGFNDGKIANAELNSTAKKIFEEIEKEFLEYATTSELKRWEILKQKWVKKE